MKFTKRHVSNSSGMPDRFLKFQDGESKTLYLKGEVYEYKNKWVNGKGVVCEPNDPEGRSRFKVNAIVNESGHFVIKIWEINLTTYNKLSEINEEYPLESIALKVTRKGAGQDTEYWPLPLLKQPYPQGLDKLDLHILNNKPAQAKPMASPPNGWDGDPMPDESDEIPF